MKKFILALSVALLISTGGHANMASPILYGTTSGAPFLSKYVDIQHEKINIKIHEGFHGASYNITYNISANKAGAHIPFLFHAADYKESFSVKVDGEAITLKELPEYYNELKDSSLNGFDYFFNPGGELIEINQEIQNTIDVSLRDLLYFEANIDSGNHLIEISYEALPWIDRSGWINSYSFRYSLSPAKYWKSFNKLTVTIDATDLKENITTNLDSTTLNGNTHTISFNTIPQDIMMINFSPKTSGFANFLISLSPLGIALIGGFILFLLNLFWIKKHPLNKWSTPMILGLVLVPILFTLIWMFSYTIIDSAIGEYASGFHGYSTFFVIFTLPISIIVYWIILVIVKNSKRS